jgi:hypothetical protein
MSRGDASVLRCYAGNVTSANAAYQRHTQLVTDEQPAPHRFAEAHLADRPVPAVIRPIDTPHSTRPPAPQPAIDTLPAVTHVLARLTGFGMTLVPNWPYCFEREHDGSEAVRVTRWTSSGPAQVVIEPGRRVDGQDIVDVADGADVPYWLIETSVFGVRWPAGFTVESPQDGSDSTPFYLQGPGRTTIFPQGPVPSARLADPDALVAPDQTVLARRSEDSGVAAIELSYVHDDEPWWQGHWTIPCRPAHLLVLTAQSLLASAEQARVAVEEVVAGFEGR